MFVYRPDGIKSEFAAKVRQESRRRGGDSSGGGSVAGTVESVAHPQQRLRLGAGSLRVRANLLGVGADFPTHLLKADQDVLVDLLIAQQDLAVEFPRLAKTLLIEVRAARGRAWAAHQRVVERLVAALDSARREPDVLPSASPMTAGFMVGAIEESIALEIGAGRAATVERLLPDLSHLVVLNYFGEDEAWLELRSTDATAQAR
jgi:hypothetical protein